MLTSPFTVVEVPFLILGLYFIITSWIDIKTHEVPDWLSYSLTALGIAFAATRTILLWNTDLAFLAQDWTIVWSVLGALIGLGLGALLYYTGQWGGGDAKLLMGTGAILGFSLLRVRDAWPNNLMALPAFIFFLGFLLVAGALYGVIWMLVLIVRKPKLFWPPYRAALRAMRSMLAHSPGIKFESRRLDLKTTMVHFRAHRVERQKEFVLASDAKKVRCS